MAKHARSNYWRSQQGVGIGQSADARPVNASAGSAPRPRIAGSRSVPRHGASAHAATRTLPRASAQRQRVLACIAAVLAVALVVVIVIVARRAAVTAEVGADATTLSASEDKLASFEGADGIEGQVGYDASDEDMSGIPEGTGLATFALDDSLANTAPSLDDAQTQTILNAVGVIEGQSSSCSFVFMNLATGRGISYNADQDIYGASSFKAVFANYVLSQFDTVAQIPHETMRNIAMTLVESDNDTYRQLHYEFDDESYYQWVEDRGYDSTNVMEIYYPSISARQMGRFWISNFQLMTNGSEVGAWYATLLGRTQTSFIRDALENQGVEVWDKAGWDDEGPELDSVSDAGILDIDGMPYLMVILTDQMDSPEAEENVSDLALALYQAQTALA